MTRGLRNNNPGNIRKNSIVWQGQIPGTDAAFATFISMAYGYRALIKLLLTYIKQGTNTIEKIITRWAPPSDGNDTKAYIAFVAKTTKIAASAPIAIDDVKTLAKLAGAISQQENGVKPVAADINAGMDLLGLKKK